MEYRPAQHKPQTLRQAKAAFKKAGGPRLSEQETRQLERRIELEDRAEQIRKAEEKRKIAKQKRAERERRDREAKAKAGIGMATQAAGYSHSQKAMRKGMERFVGFTKVKHQSPEAFDETAAVAESPSTPLPCISEAPEPEPEAESSPELSTEQKAAQEQTTKPEHTATKSAHSQRVRPGPGLASQSEHAPPPAVRSQHVTEPARGHEQQPDPERPSEPQAELLRPPVVDQQALPSSPQTTLDENEADIVSPWDAEDQDIEQLMLGLSETQVSRTEPWHVDEAWEAALAEVALPESKPRKKRSASEAFEADFESAKSCCRNPSPKKRVRQSQGAVEQRKPESASRFADFGFSTQEIAMCLENDDALSLVACSVKAQEQATQYSNSSTEYCSADIEETLLLAEQSFLDGRG